RGTAQGTTGPAHRPRAAHYVPACATPCGRSCCPSSRRIVARPPQRRHRQRVVTDSKPLTPRHPWLCCSGRSVFRALPKFPTNNERGSGGGRRFVAITGAPLYDVGSSQLVVSPAVADPSVTALLPVSVLSSDCRPRMPTSLPNDGACARTGGLICCRNGSRRRSL